MPAGMAKGRAAYKKVGGRKIKKVGIGLIEKREREGGREGKKEWDRGKERERE